MCPPRAMPARAGRARGESLKAYGRAGHYRKLGNTSRRWLRFAGNDLLQEFALAGTGTAWTEALDTASQRVNRRVFGWWFAYPWAVIEASTESLLRTGIGIPGSALTAVGSFTLVPAAYFVTPAVMSAGYAAIPGTALPLVATTWNTVIAPPLALAGEQPAPERADGFWMKRINDPAEDNIRARLVAWQSQWRDDAELVAMREALATTDRMHAEKIAALRADIDAEEKLRRSAAEAFEAQRRHVVAKKTVEQAPLLREELAAQGYTPARLQTQRGMLKNILLEQGMDEKEATRMLDVLIGPDTSLPGQSRGDAEKTDPLLQIRDRL